MNFALPREGEGIRLRRFDRNDAEQLANIEYDLDVKKYLRIPDYGRQEWIERFYLHPPNHICAVEVISERALAGRASVSTCICAPEKMELQVVISKTYWGQGLGRKAAKLLIPIAFETPDVIAIAGVVHPDNNASCKLLVSLGFILHGQKNCVPDDWQAGHSIYELSRDTYNSQCSPDGMQWNP